MNGEEMSISNSQDIFVLTLAYFGWAFSIKPYTKSWVFPWFGGIGFAVVITTLFILLGKDGHLEPKHEVKDDFDIVYMNEQQVKPASPNKEQAEQWVTDFRKLRDQTFNASFLNDPEKWTNHEKALKEVVEVAKKNLSMFPECENAANNLNGAWNNVTTILHNPNLNAPKWLWIVNSGYFNSGSWYSDCRAKIDKLEFSSEKSDIAWNLAEKNDLKPLLKNSIEVQRAREALNNALKVCNAKSEAQIEKQALIVFEILKKDNIYSKPIDIIEGLKAVLDGVDTKQDCGDVMAQYATIRSTQTHSEAVAGMRALYKLTDAITYSPSDSK